MNWRVLVLTAAVAGVGMRGWAAADQATNVLRPAVISDKAMLDSFMVEHGFHLELGAAAPMVASPVAMAFDENGRLFVVEMRDYPDHRANQPHLGRIRMLEEPNEEGVYQTSTVFADDLPLPSAIACYGGGVFVAATPEILYFKASHGGAADIKKVVLAGFGGEAPPTADQLLNSFNWGPDSRIHVATAGIGGTISAPGWGGDRTAVEGRDFSFNPRTLAITLEAGPAQSGLTFDSFGHKFVCGPAHPLQRAMYPIRYRARNPFYVQPPSLKDIASPATEVFHFDAAALDAALRAPVSAPNSRARPANGLILGWLRQSRGCVIYRGHLFPTNYYDNAFVGDPESHVIHRMVVRDNGLEAQALRPAGETNSEFLVARDDSFSPAQIANGPDGALYVADFQGGGEHGRILRIVPNNFKRPPSPQLGRAKTTELVAALSSPNGWYRDTAARLLFEQQDAAAVPLLAQMAEHARLPSVRILALRVLAEAGGFHETNALRLLRDPDPRVRAAAIQASERLAANGLVPAGIWEQFRTMPADPDIRVRCQLAFSLGEIHGSGKVPLLAQILSHDLRNPYVQNAVLSAVSDFGAGLLSSVAGNNSTRNDPAGQQFPSQLALMLGLQGQLPDVTAAINYLANSPLDWAQRFLLLADLGEGLHRTRSSLSLIDPQRNFEPLYSAALGIANTIAGPEALRVGATRVVGLVPYRFLDTGDWLLLQCQPQPFPTLQATALTTLGRYDDPKVLGGLIANWQAMTPLLRRQAVSALLIRVDRIPAVLDAIANGRIPAVDVGAVDRNFLRTYRDPNISRRAVELFGPVPLHRPDVAQQFKGALRLRGNAEHGRQLYFQRCAGCHQPDSTGATLGPLLTGARIRGRDKILDSILEPNANVPASYVASVVETKDGEVLIGIKTEENPTTITLRQVTGPAVWPRLNVDSMQTQSWSLMPDGLEAGLELQELADLVDWVMTGQIVTATP